MSVTIFNFTNNDFVVNQLWYNLAMQIGGAITAPVNFTGILVLLFCATNELRGYRWHLLTHQMCSTCSDILLNFGVFPTVYSPFPAGSVDGFLFSVFKVDKLVQVVLMFSMICVTLTSIEQLFFFRYQHILPFGDRFKMSRPKFILLILCNYIVWVVLIGGSLYAAGPDQVWAREKFVKRYPQLSHLLEIPAFYTFDIDADLSLRLFFLTYIGKITYSFIFIGLLIILSHKSLERTALSHRAKTMQKKLIYTLCVQVSVPLIIFAIPCAVLIIPIVFSIPYMYTAGLVSCVVSSTHTLFGTISLITLNTPFRIRIIRWIKSIKNRKLVGNSLSAKATDSTPTHSRQRTNVNLF